MGIHRKMRSRERFRRGGVHRSDMHGMHSSGASWAGHQMPLHGWKCALGVVLVLLPALVSASCPVSPNQCHCEVKDGKSIINCRHRDLTAVPTWTNDASFYELTLANNRISSLGSEAFKGLTIKRLDLSENTITSIDANAFSGLETSLEELLLHVNNMQAFPVQSLAGLVNLRYLMIEGFNLSSLPPAALQTLNKIHTLKMERCNLEHVVSEDFQALQTELVLLSLRGNKLVTIPKASVSQLQNLEILDLSHNKFGVLTNAFFSGNAKIAMIDFSNNQLQTVQTNAFVGLESSLETLILQNNRLTDNQLRPIQILRAIKNINIANNRVVSIPSDTFLNAQHVESLNMRTNRLTALRKEPFQPITNSLKSFDLAENVINNIEPGFFGAFKILETIGLDGQNLNGIITEAAFAGLEGSLQRLSMEGAGLMSANLLSVMNLMKLQSLSVAKNNINQIPPFTFRKLRQMTTLDLSDNSISSISQEALYGPQSSLTSVNLNNNALETIPECTFFGFTSLDLLQLNNNPLRCDCDLVWLRNWIDIKYPGSKKFLLSGWKCASPAELELRKFYDVTLAQLCPAPSTPSPAVCPDLAQTTTTAKPTEGSTSTRPPSTEAQLSVDNISYDSALVKWNMVQSNVIGYTLEVLNNKTGESNAPVQLKPNTREYMLNGLVANTTYVICINFLFQNTTLNARKCKHFTTSIEPAAVVGRTNVGAIVGAVIGVLALIALLILLGFLVVRSRTSGDPLFAMPKWFTGGKASDSAGSTTKSRTPTGIPQIGYNSKRFSRPRSRGAATVSTTSSQIQNQANSDLEMKLAGFSAEERERIISMLTTNSGGSTLSMISTGSSQRYMPELPPRPQHLEGYLNPQSIKDEEEDPYQHIYDEIPGAGANYYEIPLSSQSANEKRESGVKPPAAQYENPQGGACYI